MQHTALRRVVAVALAGLVVAAALLLTFAVTRPEASPSFAVEPPPPPPAAPDGRVEEDDGVLPPGGAEIGGDQPGVVNLDADLRSAVRAAATDAEAAGIRIMITSGWRSPEYQERLLADAEAQYGSLAEAARWVATPETSLHVAGDAVDVGSYDAMDWLGRHGAGYGLCAVYDNEPWHFELRPDAAAAGCPATYRDPTQDPRLQR